MRKYIIVVLCVFVLNACKKDPKIIYPNANGKGAYYVQETADGGFIMSGASNNGDDRQMYLLRVDASGSKLWEKDYGKEEFEWGYSIVNSNVSGFLIVGDQTSKGHNKSDFYLVKTDKQGTLLWESTIGGPHNYYAEHIISTPDSNYVIVGTYFTANNVIIDVYLTKIDESGNELWTKTLDVGGKDRGLYIQNTMDGGYVICGWNGLNSILIKTDADGIEIWNKEYQLKEKSSAGCVQLTTDGGYIITGTLGGAGNAEIFLLKTNSAGDSSWCKYFKGIARASNGFVQQTSGGGYLLLGNTRDTIGYNNPSLDPPVINKSDIYLIRTDALGATIWSKYIGGNNTSENGNCLQKTSDGGFIIAGGIYDYVSSSTTYLVKLNSNGDILWSQTIN